MKLLLDTHLLLWAAGEPKRLPAVARKLINDSRTELLFSVEDWVNESFLNAGD